MENIIETYVKEYDVMNIILTCHETRIDISYKTLYLVYSLSENDNMLQTIKNSNKYITIKFHYQLHSYKNIDILSYADEIDIYDNISKENIINIINKSDKLQKLTDYFSYVLDIDIINELYEKKFLNYIAIDCNQNIDFYCLCKIMEIKSLDTLHLRIYFYKLNNFDFQIIFKILFYAVSHLNKNIKIIMDGFFINSDKIKNYLKLIAYNFKVSEKIYTFTYIPELRKFNNLYDVDLYYL